ncbi:E2-like enzyme [Pestalotiopsis sp. IQ-011]
MATNKIPPLLEPYLGLPPEASLIVLSGVLGASTNWLVQRYLCSLLGGSNGRASAAANGDVPENGDTCVVLVSFMRDYAFWKEGAGRLGLDLDGLAKKNIFKFVDGLSGLFSDASGPNARTPVRGTSGEYLLRNATLDELQQVVQSTQQTCASPNTVLILDNPDLLLAASGSNMSGEGLRQTILHLRENVASTVITLAADEPLISAQNASLEKDHASLALSLAHEAGMLITLRLLDTGTAKDVSGVLRVTPGGDAVGFVSEERELLYFVGSDGGVRVFERGQ